MEQTGSILVRVTTSRAQLPVAGATVVVSTPLGNGSHQLLSLLETDDSGLAGPVTLSVPAPGGSAPFSNYSLWVEHPGYEVAEVASFQVFPGITSVQTIDLIPRSGGQQPFDVISAPPQSL